MVDSKASIEQSIIDKIGSRETLVAGEEDSLDQSEYVGAVRNSNLARWLSQQGEAIPIPKLSASERRPFARLVDEMVAAKATDPASDTRHLEWAIDRLVYDLYGLTEEEDTAIERSLGLIHQTDEEEDRGPRSDNGGPGALRPGGIWSAKKPSRATLLPPDRIRLTYSLIALQRETE